MFRPVNRRSKLPTKIWRNGLAQRLTLKGPTVINAPEIQALPTPDILEKMADT